MDSFWRSLQHLVASWWSPTRLLASMMGRDSSDGKEGK